MKIIYSGLSNETLEILTNNILLIEAVFLLIEETEITSSLDDLQNADILILGENISNPINLSQQVYNLEPYLSILLVNHPENYQKIRQSLLFTPFLGPTIHNVSNAAGKGLAAVIKDHLQRSQQRRSYHKIKSSSFASTANSDQKFENLKNEYLHKVMEEAPIGITLINRNGNILTYNNHSMGIFNKPEREVLGTSLADLFPENQKDSVISLTQSNERIVKKTLEFTLNNKIKYLEIALTTLKENSAYKIALIEDVTNNVLAHRAIEESAKRVNLILNSMPEMAWTALPNGEINYLNKSWFKFTGQSMEEAQGSGWKNVLHPDDLSKVIKNWKHSIESGSDYEMECRYKNVGDNQYRWHLTRAIPIKDNDEKIVLWVGTSTDIQEIHAVQQELLATTEELAASNEEIQAANEEISSNNEELQRVNETLVKLNADLDNFIYTASHDLKAPITNIEGLVNYLKNEMMDKGWEDQVTRNIIEMINTSISRFKRTITDLTEISKIQRFADLYSEEVSLKDIINEVYLDLQLQIKEAEAIVNIDVQDDLMIPFSTKNLKSIVYNLFSNAIKYRSNDRKTKISIQALENGQFHIFSITDNGLGFDIKDTSKIFSMFKRLHSHVEGSGIGLYMVKKIIDNAGGKIEVESNVGKGSTFRVYFSRK